DAGAHDELALVRLADVDVHRVRHHHAVEHRLQQLGDEGLERVRLERQPDPGAGGEHRGVPGGGEGDAAGGDPAAAGVHAAHPAAGDVEAGDLAVLDEVDAELVGLAGERPGDVVVLGDAAAAL